jgi:hypothetical protein
MNARNDNPDPSKRTNRILAALAVLALGTAGLAGAAMLALTTPHAASAWDSFQHDASPDLALGGTYTPGTATFAAPDEVDYGTDANTVCQAGTDAVGGAYNACLFVEKNNQYQSSVKYGQLDQCGTNGAVVATSNLTSTNAPVSASSATAGGTSTKVEQVKGTWTRTSSASCWVYACCGQVIRVYQQTDSRKEGRITSLPTMFTMTPAGPVALGVSQENTTERSNSYYNYDFYLYGSLWDWGYGSHPSSKRAYATSAHLDTAVVDGTVVQRDDTTTRNQDNWRRGSYSHGFRETTEQDSTVATVAVPNVQGTVGSTGVTFAQYNTTTQGRWCYDPSCQSGSNYGSSTRVTGVFVNTPGLGVPHTAAVYQVKSGSSPCQTFVVVDGTNYAPSPGCPVEAPDVPRAPEVPEFPSLPTI